jgi:hypothetical protein
VIEHKKTVIVAGVEKLRDAPPRDANTFEVVQSFLTRLRDGPESPDVFYLGQIPGTSGRFAARFDLLHTIRVPPGGPDRQSFVDARRVAVLNHEFVRDLHVRLFRAVATLGFDDHRWLSDSDLEWLVDSGRADLLKAQSKTQELRAKKSSQQAQGGRFEPKELDAAEEAEQALRESLRPYEEEQQRRRGPELSA